MEEEAEMKTSPVKCERELGWGRKLRKKDHLFCLFIFRNLVVPNQIVNESNTYSREKKENNNVKQ